MLLAYIDEIGEPGAYVSKDHRSYNTSPVFGYAGFVIPETSARRFGQAFTAEKRMLFANELKEVANPGQWERKGSDIFTHCAWEQYRNQIRVFRGLIEKLDRLGGKVFFYANQKEPGTPKQVKTDLEDRESWAMQETVNRLCRYAANQGQNLLMMVDQINEKQRAARVANIYAHMFSRAQQFPEMKAVVEPPMHIDSALSSNIQFADWVAAAVGRAIDYQLEDKSRFAWIPDALASHFHHRITTESKLHLWHSSVPDFNNFDIFKRERPYVERTGISSLSAESLERLRKVKFASARTS